MQTPIYQQIKDKMCEEIICLPANSSISSERDLALKYSASRMTVRKAISELVEEGYLYRDKNKGTFVADQKLRKKNTSTITFVEEKEKIVNKIIYFNIKNASWNKDQDVIDKLNISMEDSILKVVRLISSEGRPQSIEEIFMARKNIDDEDLGNFKKLLDLNYYIAQGSITQIFIPILIPSKYAHLLSLELNTPIILVDNIINSKNGKPLIYIKTYNNPNEKIIEITM